METELFRRRLPHWHPSNAVYFVTFRLAGSLPQETLERLKQEREVEEQKLARQFQGEALAAERYKLSKKAFARYDDLLAQSQSPRWLENAQIARIVQDEIHALHPQNYHLITHGSLKFRQVLRIVVSSRYERESYRDQ